MNKLATGLWLAACVIGMQPTWSDAASASNFGPNQVYSGSMGRCISKALMCNRNQVYSSSMHTCMLKTSRVFIPHGCPSNLDKVCTKTGNGQLINCHCVS
jgi:hypothetical protein